MGLIGLLAIGSVFAEQKSDENVMVKIGLKYNDTNMNRVDFSSQTGFYIKEYIGSDDLFESTLFQVPNKDLWARKDTAYHVRINKTYENADAAWQAKKSLMDNGFDAFYRYEKNMFLVYVGSYATHDEAANMKNKVVNFTGHESVVLKPTSTDVRIYVGDKILVFYNANETNLFFQGIETETKPSLFSYNNKQYRNGVGFARTMESDMAVINYLHMNEYLYGILPKEMSGSWPIEALKAQAVAARSYSTVNNTKHRASGFDLCATTHCQVYGGFDCEVDNSNNAVDETNGIYLLYDDKVVSCFFHSNSGGATESIEHVWSRGIPYLTSVPDPVSLEAPRTFWEKDYTFQELELLLNRKGLYPGAIDRVYALENSDSGRVLKLAIEGSSNTIVLEKNNIRSVLGYTALKSTLFTIESNNTVIIRSKDNYTTRGLEKVSVISASGKKTFSSGKLTVFDGVDKYQKNVKMEKVVLKGQGYGHGVGMSQWGAKVMADSGENFMDILTHYYSGTYFNKTTVE